MFSYNYKHYLFFPSGSSKNNNYYSRQIQRQGFNFTSSTSHVRAIILILYDLRLAGYCLFFFNNQFKACTQSSTDYENPTQFLPLLHSTISTMPIDSANGYSILSVIVGVPSTDNIYRCIMYLLSRCSTSYK